MTVVEDMFGFCLHVELDAEETDCSHECHLLE